MSSNIERKSRKKRQTRLLFNPVDRSSSPASKSPAKVRYQLPGPRGTPVSTAKTTTNGSESEDILSSSARTLAASPSASKAKMGNLPSKALPTLVKSQPSSRIEIQIESRRTRSSQGARTTPLKAAFLSQSNTKKGKSKVVEVEDNSSSNGSESEELSSLPSKKKTGTSKQKAQTKLKPIKTEKRIDYVELSSDPSSGESDLPARKKNGQTSDVGSIPVRRRQPQDQVSDGSEEPISSPLKRRRPIAISSGSDESDASDVVSSPMKKRRHNYAPQSDSSEASIPARSRKSQPKGPVTKSPSRFTRQSKAPKHRTEKQKTMELLKRRRAGENIEALTESESESESENSAEVYQELSEFDDESGSEVNNEPEEPAKKKKTKQKANQREDQNEYDSDFVVDDDEGNLGVPNPALLDIPLEFTHAAHKSAKEHFKDAIEWMVQNKLNPAFSRDDPVYVQAFKKLDDEYSGYAKSKFVSSQWTAEFTRAIYARPELLQRDLAIGEGIDVTGEAKCDVCNHRKHVPKFEIQFSGKAYYKDSLDEVEQDTDDEDSQNDDSSSGHRSVNADGQTIPSEDTTWFSGRFCMANASQAHSLIHWKHALNSWVVGNLEQEGYLAPEKLAEREKMKSKRRRQYANDVVDKWAADGHLKDLYRDFKINLQNAREAQQTRWSGGRLMAQ